MRLWLTPSRCFQRFVVIDNCASGPCQNGGSCINSINGYMCACPPGYTNKECQTRGFHFILQLLDQ